MWLYRSICCWDLTAMFIRTHMECLLSRVGLWKCIQKKLPGKFSLLSPIIVSELNYMHMHTNAYTQDWWVKISLGVNEAECKADVQWLIHASFWRYKKTDISAHWFRKTMIGWGVILPSRNVSDEQLDRATGIQMQNNSCGSESGQKE